MSDSTSQSVHPSDNSDNRQWLAGLLLRHSSAILPRFANYFDKLVRLPRHARRALRQRLALTVAGAALLLSLSRAPALTSSITVADGAVLVTPDGKCSLIEAINNANDTADGIAPGAGHTDCNPGNPGGADTISLPSNGQFTLTSPFTQAGYQVTGLPPITSDITLLGNRSVIYRPAAAGAFNLLTVAESGRFTLKEASLQGGANLVNSGGAIMATGDLHVADSHFRGNSGGAISAAGDNFTIQRSMFTDNDGHSAIIRSGATNFALEDCLISGNRGGSQGSGGVAVYSGTAKINSTTFIDNSSEWGQGAALSLSPNTNTVVDDSWFVNNETTGFGGAIAVDKAQLTLVDSIISGNTAGNGGGIFSDGATITIRRSTIEGNTARSGGGGIFSRYGQSTLENSTVSGNIAEKDHPYERGAGGGIFGYYESITLVNTTIAGNQAVQEGGGVWIKAGPGRVGLGELTVIRTLITGNTAPKGPQVNALANMYVTVADYLTVNDFNLFGADGDAGVFGFTPGTNDIVPVAGITVAQIIDPAPVFGFGSTPTHALPPGSPAIDAAPSAPCEGMTDQRGFDRNFDGDGVSSANECDIGAFERGPDLDQHAFLPFIRATP